MYMDILWDVKTYRLFLYGGMIASWPGRKSRWTPLEFRTLRGILPPPRWLCASIVCGCMPNECRWSLHAMHLRYIFICATFTTKCSFFMAFPVSVWVCLCLPDSVYLSACLSRRLTGVRIHELLQNQLLYNVSSLSVNFLSSSMPACHSKLNYFI